MSDVIKKDDLIVKVIREHPETIPVFLDFGVHCIGCAAAQFETVEQGAAAHGIQVEELLKALNKAIEEAKS